MNLIAKVNSIKEVEIIGKDGQPFVAWRVYAPNCIMNVSSHCEGYKQLANVAKGDNIAFEYYETEKNGSLYKNAKSLKLLDSMSDIEVVQFQLKMVNDKLDLLLEKCSNNKLANKIEGITKRFSL